MAAVKVEIETVVFKDKYITMTDYAVRMRDETGFEMQVSAVLASPLEAVEDVERRIAGLDAAAGGRCAGVTTAQRRALAALRRKVVAAQA